VRTRSATVAAEPSAGAGAEQWVAGSPGAFGEPNLDQVDHRAAEGHGAVFAAFAFAADVGAVAEGHVGAVEADEFGDTEPGLHGQQHHGPVPSAFPSVRVGGGD
jgi:hypothetical protein